MSESGKYHCDECKNELSVSFVRLQQMLDASYKLKMQNNKLLEFVKLLANDNPGYYDGMPVVSDAQKLLKEIGES